MKNPLLKLPKRKQNELKLIKKIILEKVPDVRMIVLFGSYARGEQVEDIHKEGHTTHVYQSDFDILVATKSKKEANDASLHDLVEKTIDATKKVKTPHSIIYHTFNYVRQMVVDGQYFFTDIKKEGIQLYHKGKYSLGKAKTLTPHQRKQIAKEDFKLWFKKAKGFYRQFEHALNDRDYKIAAFDLHQSTECFYSAVTLVFINYRFRTHNIELLGIKAVSYDTAFAKAFPLDTIPHRKAFTLLKKAYVDARYKKNYKITKRQLEYLAKRVKVLQELTKKICSEKIVSFV
ncbi:MAG: HEPN domain-containing protein [Phycisphaerae bacterium]|jgi:predicted nucleotidyltransferase/HEPN domain-containing protein